MKKIFVFALLLAGCATPLSQSPPSGIPASVTPQQAAVGDSWTYQWHDGYTGFSKGSWRHTLAAVGPQSITVEVSHDGKPVATQVYTQDWNWLEKPLVNLQNFRYSPPYPALPFPLEAGKHWQTYIQATDPATGQAYRVRIDGKVLGWERVKVPAGEYDALKIRRLVYAGNHDYFRGEENIVEYDWYAPRIGRLIKQVSSSGYHDKTQGCDDGGGCNNWVLNDWNVIELSDFQHVDTQSRP